MINWILSFVLCSGMLLGAYYLILKNESLYRFNRFFLLLALLFSAAVPFMTVHLPEKISQLKSQMFQAKPTVTAQPSIQIQPALQAQPVIVESTIQTSAAQLPAVNENTDWHKFLWLLYILPALVLLVRFIRNSYFIRNVVKRHPIIPKEGVKLVLIADDVTPHSFLRYVFLNKRDYDAGLIEPQIICHERAHINQLHSVDVLLIELLQVFCWFNPFIPLYKRAIQLNHEFLADEAVTKTYTDITQYQHLLLAKASLPGSMSLTSQFNYLTIKSRIVMMTKTTSAKMALLKGTMLIFLTAATLIVFCHKVYAQSKQPDLLSTKKILDKNVPKQPASDAVMKEYKAILVKYNQQSPEKWPVRRISKKDEVKLKKFFVQMDQQQRDSQWVQFVATSTILLEKITITAAQLNQWKNAKVYGVSIDSRDVKNSDLNKYKPSDFARFDMTDLNGTDRKKYGYDSVVYLMTRGEYGSYKRRHLHDTSMYITHNQDTIKNKLRHTPDVVRFPPPIVFPDPVKYEDVAPAATDAPQSVIDEYRALLKKNHMPADKKGKYAHPAIYSGDWEKMIALFDKMSKSQQDAQSVKFGKLQMPMDKQQPTDELLKDLQNSSDYQFWIDGRPVGRSLITKYQPADFDFYQVHDIPKNFNLPFKHRVILWTPAYYAKFCETINKLHFRQVL